MNEDQIKKLRAHAGKLVAEGKTLAGAFTYTRPNGGSYPYQRHNVIPDFEDGNEWHIAKPKKQLIDWSHPYFKGCATNYGEMLGKPKHGDGLLAFDGDESIREFTRDFRLTKPANEHANWQPFFSTPENDKKLRELAKMVKVEVRYWNSLCYGVTEFKTDGATYLDLICNYRITGLQDGWTDNPSEAQQ